MLSAYGTRGGALVTTKGLIGSRTSFARWYPQPAELDARAAASSARGKGKLTLRPCAGAEPASGSKLRRAPPFRARRAPARAQVSGRGARRASPARDGRTGRPPP